MVKKKDQVQEIISPQDALAAAISSLQKDYGTEIVSGYEDISGISFIPSGSVGLDIALNGGYARGRIIEIYGAESAGKTTLALHAIASAQKLGLLCAYIDVEHALDGTYATALGANIEQAVISQPNSGEQALNVAERLIRSKACGLIIIDSVAALVPEAEIEGQVGDQHMGLQARLMSQAMRKFAAIARNNNTAVIFINQMRMKIGVMFGNPETTSGGNALKFYASQRLDIRRIKVLGSEDNKYGITSRVKVVKNKVGRPFRETEIDIIFGQGIDSSVDLLRAASRYNVLAKSGAWYSFNEVKLGCGEEASAKYLTEHPETAGTIRELVLNAGLQN